MKYINFITVPDLKKYQKDLMDFYNKLGDPNRVWWCYFEDDVKTHMPDFYDMWKHEFGITLHQLIYFVNYKNDTSVTDPKDEKCVFIHVDAMDGEDQGETLPLDQRYATKFVPRHAINIPLLHCEDSFTIWYETIDDRPHEYYPKYDCGGFNPISVKEVYRTQLTGPAVIKVDVPHGVYVPHHSPRIVATMRFKEPLDFLLEQQGI